jgi:hypothetical protein
MPRSSASNTKRAISATGGKDDSTEPLPKISKKGAKGTNGDEKNLEVVAPSEKKTRAKKGAAAGMEADDDASLKKKSKKSPVNGDGEADNKPKAKKAAVAKHQILTERDEIPKLWNAEEHKDSYSEYLVGFCVDASMSCF